MPTSLYPVAPITVKRSKWELRTACEHCGAHAHRMGLCPNCHTGQLRFLKDERPA